MKQTPTFRRSFAERKQAQLVGITDFSPRSLKRFDDWYFNYYPHLFLVHIPFTEMAGLDVLEVGLGYGTVSRRLAEWDSRFIGLDITPGAADLLTGACARPACLARPGWARSSTRPSPARVLIAS